MSTFPPEAPTIDIFARARLRRAVELAAADFFVLPANRGWRSRFLAGRLPARALYLQVLAGTYRLLFQRFCRRRRLPDVTSILRVDSTAPDLADVPLMKPLRSEVEKCTDHPDHGFENFSAVYETMLDLQPVLDRRSGRFQLREGLPRGRKSTGCYYTPPALIETLLDSTLEPLLEGDRDVSSLKVCDPSCGTGHFLLAAAKRMAGHVRESRARSAVLRRGVRRCLHGLDIDPLAVELCRMNLWLAGGGTLSAARAIAGNIRHADTLFPDSPAHPLPETFANFDVIIGNPPHGAALSPSQRNALKRRYPPARSASNTAADFLLRSAELAHPGGHIGLVMPKSLTYSHAWAALRKWLAPRLTHAVDVSKAWKDVRLEQVLVAYRPEPPATSEAHVGLPAGRKRAAGFSPRGRPQGAAPSWPVRDPGHPRLAQLVGHRVNWQPAATAKLVDQLGIIPTGLTGRDRRLAGLMFRAAPHSLSDFCTTRRGTALQRLARPSGDIALLAGKDIADFQPPVPARFLREAEVAPSMVRFTDPPQAVFQNIVAHLQRPTDHIHLIGTVVTGRVAVLDTVNLLTPTDPRLTPHALAGLLMSDLINWFVYVCIYNRAVRTMHFDGFILRKIPVPNPGQLRDLDAPARDLFRRPGGRSAWQALNEHVCACYRIPASVAAEITRARKPRFEEE